MDVTEIDARGLLCPLPVLKLAKRIKTVTPGDHIRLLADDPAAIVDVPHYAAESGHVLIETQDAGDHQIYILQKIG